MRSSVEPRADTIRIGVAAASSSPRTARIDGPAVQLGEHQVEDDERRPVAFDGVEGGRAVRRGHDREAVALEVRAHQPDDLGVVVDDQDRSLGERRGGRARHRQHGRGARVGRRRDRTVKAVADGGACRVTDARVSQGRCS